MRVLMLGSQQELGLLRVSVLEQAGMEVTFPNSKQAALAAIREGKFDTVLMSHTLSSETALELAELTRQHCPRCPIVLISDSAWHDTKIAPDATVLGDLGPDALIAAIRKAAAGKLHRVK